MRGQFLHALYAKTNPDVAEKFGVNAKAKLEEHYSQYGFDELRGGSVVDHMCVENVFVSDCGYIFISGWADQRMLPNIRFSMDIGYIRYKVNEPNLVWYDRPDVSRKLKDTENPSGFVAVFKVQEITIHPRVCVRMNETIVHEEKLTRLHSLASFVDSALGACAVVADMPIGNSFEAGTKLYPIFAELWSELQKKMHFANAFHHQKDELISQSIVIVVHRRADMLLRQLEELASFLQTTDVEVVLIGNDLEDSFWITNALAAFCQIYPINISLFLCNGNSGFSFANNFGAQKTKGDVIVFMNPDVFPPEGALHQAISFFESDPGDALHGAALYYGDGMLMHSGMYATYDTVIDQKRGVVNKALRVEHFGKGLGHRVEDEDQSPAFQMIKDRSLLVTAALWKIRKSVFEAAGGFPSDYIVAYYEDADFCLRFLENGGEVVMDHNSRWLHLEGVARPKAPQVRSFMWLNRVHFSEKYSHSKFLASPEDDWELL